MKLKYSILLLLIFILFACKKKIEEPSIVEIIEPIWQTPLLDGYNMDPILYNDVIISSYRKGSDGASLIAIDKKNGDIIWEWKDYIEDLPYYIYGKSNKHIYNNVFTFYTETENYAIDLNTGLSIWNNTHESDIRSSSLFDNFLFYTLNNWSSTLFRSSILMMDIEDGDWNEVYEHADSNEVETIVSPVGFINSQNDTLLIYSSNPTQPNYEFKYGDVYCYNKTQDSLSWKIDDLIKNKLLKLKPLYIDNHYVYTRTDNELYCIDVLQGEMEWNKSFEDITGSNYLIYKNLLILSKYNGDIIALNKFTGEEVWLWNEGYYPDSNRELSVYNNRLYFGSYYLYILNADNGQTMYTFKSPNEENHFYSAVSVDLANSKMYCFDFSFLLCMELPD